MFTLILLLVVGSLLVYLSKFNFVPVSLNLGFVEYSQIPLFYVIVGAIVIGLFVSYFLHLVSSIPASLSLRTKEKEIKVYKDEVLELTKKIHQLELTNEKQKNGDVEIPDDPKSL